MDKIQDAIAKARAARQDAAVATPGAREAADMPRATPRGVPTPRPTPAATAAAQSEAAIAAAWQAIPQIELSPARLRRGRIMTVEGGRDATDFDVLRTRILQQAKANGWRRVAITSPGPGCGKSTLILNLAFSLARQPDQRTLVCEMDMRRPSLARTLGLKDDLNLSAAMRGEASFEENARRFGDNLIISTNAAPVPRAAELLQSAGGAAVLDDVMARYDPTIALFDMPPLLAGDDTMAFINQVDCVILLAAAEQSTIKQIDACEQDIASQTNVMGVVLNKCRYMDRDNSYAYYE